MMKGWWDLLPFTVRRNKNEFVSMDARNDLNKDSRSYEMLSKETNVEVTPLSPVMMSPPPAGRRTPDYFGQSARYHAPSRSYSSPRPPSPPSWDPQQTYANPQKTYHPTNYEEMNPLGMNKLRE